VLIEAISGIGFAMTKAHILSEIQRTAAENRGAPLGSDRFASETGIKKHDWYGVHWARWGDALREAGFAPNTLQGAYDKAELLEKYASLAQQLGRLPASGDLRLKSRSDPEFPSHGTFNRFGTKLQLIQQLNQFCRSHNQYVDVAGLCDAYQSASPSTKKAAQPNAVELGFVYLIKSGRFHKIGKSNSAGRREYELAIQLPEKAKTVHTIRTDDPIGIEAYWHNRFESKRKNGEWFDLDAADVAAFKRRKFM
jgi:Meiotically up-regulated gene 113